jgi:hypothetical protein
MTDADHRARLDTLRAEFEARAFAAMGEPTSKWPIPPMWRWPPSLVVAAGLVSGVAFFAILFAAAWALLPFLERHACR